MFVGVYSFFYLVSLISFVEETSIIKSLRFALKFWWIAAIAVAHLGHGGLLVRVQAFFGFLVSYVYSVVIFFEWLKVYHFKGVTEKVGFYFAVCYTVH